MFKIIDRYTLKTFFGPFLFIFSILMFILLVNVVWTKLGLFIGKGLSTLQILKLLYYLGMGVVSLVLPLTILLGSIMTFGGLGERYELAAIKASGGSLLRVMAPLFLVSIGFSFLLFFYSSSLIPDFQRKIENMRSNLKDIKPSLIFSEGEFNNTLPQYTLKFDKFLDEHGKNLEGIYIRKRANSYQSQQSIIAKKGKFKNVDNINFLKLELYNGYINEEYINNIKYSDRPKQPDQAIKFDTLTYLFDISEFVEKNLDKEKIKSSYKFLNYKELNPHIIEDKKEHQKELSKISQQILTQTNSYLKYIEKNPKSKTKIAPSFKIDTLDNEKKLQVLVAAHQKLEQLKKTSSDRISEYKKIHKRYSRVVMHQQKMLTLSFSAIVFFLIGASLGSIIRKGGIGLPIVFSIVIYMIFYTLSLAVENLSWSGAISPYLAVWMPNLILFPFSLWLTYKAVNDSQLFDVDKYKKIFEPIKRLFVKNKEHKRYQ